MGLWVRIVFVTASPEAVEAAIVAHRAQLRELRGEGRLRLALELAAGDGFVDVFDAADRHEAERIARASAVVREGLGSVVLKACLEGSDPVQAPSDTGTGGSTQRP